MASPLRLMRRIAAMSLDEIKTRTTMEVRKRVDAWEARRGKNPLQPRHIHQPRATSTAPAPRFFFDARQAASVAAEAKRRLPSECESVIESARRIQERSFDLLGYRGLSFGKREIAWHRDPVHGIEAPYKPWFRIPYLDFRQSGDHKIVWELSRHQHLMLLARAWLYTGDRQFLATVEELWQDWRKANPYPMGINWASTLEVAFRCLSWIWIDHFTADSADSKHFRANLREGIGECAVYTERYLSTYFAPNTHLLGEALALFFVGVLYPEFERARFWREYGWEVILQESSRQVRQDGFHFEQSTYYHVYALDMFLHARVLAVLNGIAIPQSYDSTLALMAEGLAFISAAGQPPRFGDDDGGRLFDGRRNHSEHMLDPMATAAIIYDRAEWKAVAGDLREETIWLLGADGIRVFDQLPATRRPDRSVAFPASGYYTMASANAIAIVDGGPLGWGSSGHGHADTLSLQLIAGGRPWLTDPGTASYPMEKPERDQFRSTAAHNTLEVDGRSQAEPVHSFAWRSLPVTTIHQWYEGNGITVFHGSHDGYSRLTPPVTHERWVIGWADDVWMVADCASGEGAHRLDLRWHLSPDCSAVSTETSNVWRFTVDNDSLDIIAPAIDLWRITSETGSWSPAYGAVVPAPVLHLSREGSLPASCVSVIALNQPGRVVARPIPAPGAEVYLLIAGETTKLVGFAKQPGSWRCGPIETDARLLVVEYSPTEVHHILAIGGSQLRIGDDTPAIGLKAQEVWESVSRDGRHLILSSEAARTLSQSLERFLESDPAGEPSITSNDKSRANY